MCEMVETPPVFSGQPNGLCRCVEESVERRMKKEKKKEAKARSRSERCGAGRGGPVNDRPADVLRPLVGPSALRKKSCIRWLVASNRSGRGRSTSPMAILYDSYTLRAVSPGRRGNIMESVFDGNTRGPVRRSAVMCGRTSNHRHRPIRKT